jgi:ribosomal subunit interface protein
MKVLVTARHCEIDDELRQRAIGLVQKAAKLTGRPRRAEVVFDDDHKRKIVEFQLYLPAGHTYVASAEASSFLTAMDRAAAKLRNQLDKLPSHVDKRSVVGER